ARRDRRRGANGVARRGADRSRAGDGETAPGAARDALARIRPGRVAPGNRRDPRPQNREHQTAPLPRPQETRGAAPQEFLMTCPRESETLEAITTARWPEELQQH